MMIKTAVQVWDAALAMSPGDLIDKFLDWVEELSNTMVVARSDALALIKIRSETQRDC